jgi:hypothetical protein
VLTSLMTISGIFRNWPERVNGMRSNSIGAREIARIIAENTSDMRQGWVSRHSCPDGFDIIGHAGSYRNVYLHLETGIVYKAMQPCEQPNHPQMLHEVRMLARLRRMDLVHVIAPRATLYAFKITQDDETETVFVTAMDYIEEGERIDPDIWELAHDEIYNALDCRVTDLHSDNLLPVAGTEKYALVDAAM